MESGFGESISVQAHGPSCSRNISSDTGDFECNICFELAQDPIVTLCGHLYCWSCLYRWLHMHSHSHECPVCKALVQEDKLVPLYGRGRTPSDPRSRYIPGINIPSRPTGQRPETAAAPNGNNFAQQGFGLGGGIMPMAYARFGSLTLSFGGLIPALLNFQAHGFHDATVYGTTSGYPHGFLNSFHGGNTHGFHQQATRQQQRQSDTSFMKMCVLLFGLIVIIALIWPSNMVLP